MLHAEGPEGADRWENVRELVASAADWSEEVSDDPESGTPLERFLAEAALLSSAETVDRQRGRRDAHDAAHRQGSRVAGGGAHRAWSTGSSRWRGPRSSPTGLEEERRLCYVGLTRAKDKLYLTWARARRRGGELRPGIPSRFLKALPPGIVEERRTTSLWAPDWGRASGAAATGQWCRGGVAPERAAIPAARAPDGPIEAEASQDTPRYVKGERVRHRRFGSGTIRGLSGVGRDLKVSVAFDDEEVGEKQLLVAYAGLEREWESA